MLHSAGCNRRLPAHLSPLRYGDLWSRMKGCHIPAELERSLMIEVGYRALFPPA